MPNQPAANHDPNRTLVYQIRIKGQLGRHWRDWFGEVTIRLEEDGNTLITCPVVDQAALHGLLKKVRDLGVTLLSVTRIDPGDTAGPDARQ